MKKLLDALASLKLAVALLVLLLLGLAAGTIIESSHGTDAAAGAVYYSWWFLGLQLLFAISLIASLASLFPWGRQRIGFLTTHAALLVILTGATVSYFFKVEGQIMLWEGESGHEIVDHDRQGRITGRAALPFLIKLDDFRIDYYPGTMRPANFRSDVQVIDPAGGIFKAAIWMNHELEYRGWRFFQSSYRQESGREATVLSASKDPGQPIVFVGYGLLVLGMCTVLGTRIAQTRARTDRDAAATTKKGLGKAAALGIGAALAIGAPARAADPMTESLKRLPVQHDGRVMPFDTLAREAVWNVTGQGSWNGADPAATVASWIFDPRAAATAPVVEVGSGELAAASGLPAGTTHASFALLVSNRTVMQLFEQAARAASMDRPRQGLLAAAEKLEGRLLWLQRILNRDVVRSVPPPGDVNARWEVPQPMRGAADLVALATGPRLQGWPAPSAVERELTYNGARPARIAWLVLLAALLLSIVAWNRKSRLLDGLALAGLLAGFGVMTWGIATRWAIAGRIPASNMFESLLFLAWGVGLFAVVAFALMRNRLVVLNANAMAALTMALTDLLPIDGFVHPVAPVLAGTPWLAIHVPIIMISYSVLALGVVVAHMQIGFTIFAPGRREIIQRMYELLYWYVHVGSILLVTGIMTGSIWAASSWGRYWGWDPKEVWSLVAFLAYVAILHGRWDRIIGPFGVAAISIVAFQAILMTYLGVNFVLTTGLHSYAFGDSPVVKWMVLVATAETVFLLWGLAAHRRLQSGGDPGAGDPSPRPDSPGMG